MALSPAHTLGGSSAAVQSPPGKLARHSELDVTLPAMDALSEELTRLAAINAELIGQLRGAAANGEMRKPAESTDNTELDVLRLENEELRARIAEMEQLLAANAEEAWADQQREYEALLEEKSEVIRSLHLKVQELQETTRRAPDEPLPKEEEIRQLKADLDEQRRQLREDEESLMTQMRQMELALSKDRAELARQRQELQRLQTELNREIEQSGRDSGLRERLMNLRRTQEPAKKETAPTAPNGEASSDSKKNSGLFRRLFG
jgi:hypothetical protein